MTLPYYPRSFEAHIDTYVFTIRVSTNARGYFIAYESQKFNDTDNHHSLPTNMEGLPYRQQVHHNDRATSYFKTHKKLNPKHAHWQDFLVEFDYYL